MTIRSWRRTRSRRWRRPFLGILICLSFLGHDTGMAAGGWATAAANGRSSSSAHVVHVLHPHPAPQNEHATSLPHQCADEACSPQPSCELNRAAVSVANDGLDLTFQAIMADSGPSVAWRAPPRPGAGAPLASSRDRRVYFQSFLI